MTRGGCPEWWSLAKPGPGSLLGRAGRAGGGAPSLRDSKLMSVSCIDVTLTESSSTASVWAMPPISRCIFRSASSNVSPTTVMVCVMRAWGSPVPGWPSSKPVADISEIVACPGGVGGRRPARGAPSGGGGAPAEASPLTSGGRPVLRFSTVPVASPPAYWGRPPLKLATEPVASPPASWGRPPFKLATVPVASLTGHTSSGEQYEQSGHALTTFVWKSRQALVSSNLSTCLMCCRHEAEVAFQTHL
mmetsp:Transcript_15619/g.45695  ORF Transcript_15619/g.45695 Transcript_15619/m.45695 type:complete len:247 (+) Transcript_15619:52-792(+)